MPYHIGHLKGDPTLENDPYPDSEGPTVVS